MELSISDLIQLFALLGLVTAVVYGIIKYTHDYFNRELMYNLEMKKWLATF